MDKIKIADVDDFRSKLGMTHLVVFAVDKDGRQYVATHGDTVQHGNEAALAGNRLKDKLGWPAYLCHEKPLDRICLNCRFKNECSLIAAFWELPESIRVSGVWDGCNHFKPNV